MGKLRKILIRKRRKDESLFKYAMGLFHLWGALVSFLVICTICLTGCIYAFKTQIIDLYNYDKVFIQSADAPINVNKIQEDFTQKGRNITSLFIPKDKGRSWSISYTDAQGYLHSTYFNPYTMEELGAQDHSLDGFFETVLGLHRNLLLGSFGRQIVGGSVIIFVLLLFSGFVLWLPKRLKFLKESLTVKFSAKFQRINYDLHRTMGIYSMVFLLLIAVTGLYVTYPWVKNAIITSLGGESLSEINADKTAPEEDDEFAKLMEDMLAQQDEKENTDVNSVPLSQILAEIQKHLNYEGNTTIILPNAESPRYQITKINSENTLGAMFTDEISLDKTGQLKSKDLFADKPLSKQFTMIARPLHTGEIMGLPSIIFYFFMSLIGFLLPVTGLMIWWNRVKKQF